MQPRFASADVPCGTCSLCCRHELVFVKPELGDATDGLLTVTEVDPTTGKPGLRLLQKPDGSCVHLTEEGCSVHPIRPTICRIFDCRRLATDGTRAERRRREKTVPGFHALAIRGRELLKEAE